MLDINIDDETQLRAMPVRRSRRRVDIVIGGLLIGFGVVFFMISDALSRLFRLNFLVAQLLSGASFLVGLGILLMSYLRGDFASYATTNIQFATGGYR